MDVDSLRFLIIEYESSTDLNYKMKLANRMIDIIKKDIWQLVGKIREEMLG